MLHGTFFSKQLYLLKGGRLVSTGGSSTCALTAMHSCLLGLMLADTGLGFTKLHSQFVAQQTNPGNFIYT
jgi:hypothetical protein